MSRFSNGPDYVAGYVICSTVRSGSTLLSRTLEGLEECGQPQEYFHRHVIEAKQLHRSSETFSAYCQSIVNSSVVKNSVVNSSVENGGVFGMKMHWWQLEDFLVMARHAIGTKSAMDLSDRAVLERFFPGLKFVYLQREDGVAQAVSAAIASQSGEWEKREFAEKVRPRVIKFHPWKIYEWESLIKEQNQAWETFFAESGIVPYRLTYERLTSSFSQEVSQVLSYLALPEASSKPDQHRHFDMPVKRQSTVANQRLITAYKTLPRPVSALSLWLYRQLKPLPPSPVLSIKSLEGGAQ